MKVEKLETYSNIAYFISGLIGFFLFEDWTTRIVFFLAMTFLCVGSFIYHKHKEGDIFLFDWHTIIVAFTTFAGLLFNNEWAWVALISFQFIYGLFIIGRFNVYVEVLAGSLPLIIAMFIYLSWWHASLIILGFGIAALIRNHDNQKNTKDIYYDSKNHSWWHVITAIMPIFIYL